MIWNWAKAQFLSPAQTYLYCITELSKTCFVIVYEFIWPVKNTEVRFRKFVIFDLWRSSLGSNRGQRSNLRSDLKSSHKVTSLCVNLTWLFTISKFDRLTYFRWPIFQNGSELGQIWDHNIKGLDARNSHVKDECCSSKNKGDMTKNVKRSNGWPLVDLDLWPGKYWWKTCFVIVYDPLDLFWQHKITFWKFTIFDLWRSFSGSSRGQRSILRTDLKSSHQVASYGMVKTLLIKTLKFDRLTYFRWPISRNGSELGQIWDHTCKRPWDKEFTCKRWRL